MVVLPKEVEIQERRLGLVSPLRTGAGELAERVILLFRVVGADGLEGVGESAPLAWVGTEDLAASRRALEQARGALLAGQATDLRETPAAAAAVELALLDLASRRAGQALCHHLTPEPATSVAVNALLGSNAIDELLTRAVNAVDSGFRTLKLKVGARGPGFERSLSGCVDRVAALRDTAVRTDKTDSVNARQEGEPAGRRLRGALAFIAPGGFDAVKLSRRAQDSWLAFDLLGPALLERGLDPAPAGALPFARNLSPDFEWLGLGGAASDRRIYRLWGEPQRRRGFPARRVRHAARYRGG